MKVKDTHLSEICLVIGLTFLNGFTECKGFYCIYKKGDCPTGMVKGCVHWDDEDSGNRNRTRKKGELPDGDCGSHGISIDYCCQENGHWYNSVELPVDRPFYLLPHNSTSSPKCQLVKWALTSLEYIVYDTEDNSNIDKFNGSHVYIKKNGSSLLKVHYCYYKGCRYNMTDPNGSFSSPNYLSPVVGYPQFQYCSWLISVNEAFVILLNFTSFNFTISNCNKHFVRVYDGLNDKAPIRATYCSLNGTAERAVISSSNNVYVVANFGSYSENAKVSSGFHALYSTHLHSTGCQYNMTDPYGSFSSPNYLSPVVGYPQFQYCSWLISVNETFAILLNFTSFNFGISNCDKHFVRVYDGLNEKAPIRATYCNLNGTSNSAVISSSNNVYVVANFGSYSGNAKVSSGFHAQYSTHLKSTGCQYNMTEPYGSFSSPNYISPVVGYLQFGYCSWLISVNETYAILLNFTSFNFGISNCDKHFVRVYDGLNEKAPIRATYCSLNGTSKSTVLSSSNNVYVVANFGSYSGNAKVSSGFHAQYSTHLKSKGRCDAETTGDNVTQGIFFWKATRAKSYSKIKCPYGSSSLKENDSGQATRYCECRDEVTCKETYWLKPMTQQCNYKVFNDSNTTGQLSDILQTLLSGKTTVLNVSEALISLTSSAPKFQPEDVTLTAVALENIFQRSQDLKEIGPKIVATVNNILNASGETLAQSQKDSNSSARILQIVKDYMENIPIEIGANVTINKQNIALFTKAFNASNFQGASAESQTDLPNDKGDNNFVVHDNNYIASPLNSQVSLTIPQSIFETLNIGSESQGQRISFVVFRKTPLFQSRNNHSSDAKAERKKNSWVIAGSIKGQNVENLTDPVVLTYRPLAPAVDESSVCLFWDFGKGGGVGDWSSVGCAYQGTTNGIVTCHCNHLTNFAMLMDVYIDDYNEDAHDKALSIISYIGCAVSLVGLLLTIITILSFRDLRTKVPIQILLNFCTALSLTLVLFVAVAALSKTSSVTSCRAGAILLHYFVLATFMWMAIEALSMYLAFVKVMPAHYSHFMQKCCFVGWGLPAIIVIITAALAIDEYGDKTFCRLQGLPFQLAFLAPVILILVGNSVAFVLVLRSLLTSRSKVSVDSKVSGLKQAKRGTAILVVLGLTWMTGVLAVKDAKLVFQYLFCILNSIQGLLVFLFYCVLSVETRAKYKMVLYGKGKDMETRPIRCHDHASSSDSRFHEIPGKSVPSDTLTQSTKTWRDSLNRSNNVMVTRF